MKQFSLLEILKLLVHVVMLKVCLIIKSCILDNLNHIIKLKHTINQLKLTVPHNYIYIK